LVALRRERRRGIAGDGQAEGVAEDLRMPEGHLGREPAAVGIAGDRAILPDGGEPEPPLGPHGDLLDRMEPAASHPTSVGVVRRVSRRFKPLIKINDLEIADGYRYIGTVLWQLDVSRWEGKALP
jgi:hypothetical protein